MNLRIEAINSFSNDRATTDDAAYLRGLYAQGRQRSDEGSDHQRDRRASADTENDQWMLDHRQESRTSRASSAPRRSRRLMRSNLPIARSRSSSTTPSDSATTSARRSSSALEQSQGARGVGQADRHRQEQHRQSTSARRRCNALMREERSAQRSRSAGHPRREEAMSEPHTLRSPPRSSRRPAPALGAQAHREPSRRRSRRPRAVHVRRAPRHLRQRTHATSRRARTASPGRSTTAAPSTATTTTAFAPTRASPGPVRVVIDRADKLPLSVQTYVGPPDSTLRGVTDLGHVRAQDAADYLLSLAGKIDGRAGRDALFPAMLADSANTARDARHDREEHGAPARDAPQRAVVHGSLDRRHADDSGERHRADSRHRTRRNRQPVGSPAGALGARPPRSRLRHSAAHPAVAADAEQLAGEGIDVRRSRAPAIRARASICARRCKRTDLPDEVLTVALRALGQEYATAQDAALLRELYPTLKSDRSREAVFSALAEIGGSENTKWMLEHGAERQRADSRCAAARSTPRAAPARRSPSW